MPVFLFLILLEWRTFLIKVSLFVSNFDKGAFIIYGRGGVGGFGGEPEGGGGENFATYFRGVGGDFF